MDAEKLYEIAIDTRKFEIQLFWQRSNYFLLLSTAIATGCLASMATMPLASSVLAAFGLVVSYLWFNINCGGKYWQTRWEAEAARMEKHAVVGANLFSSSREDTDYMVATFIEKHGQWDGFNIAILRKPSVSRTMMWLSVWFSILWVVLLAIAVCRTVTPSPVKDDGSVHSATSPRPA
jgi:polyferredoxin